MNRRTFLATAGALVPLAGCTSVLGSESEDSELEYPEARCAEGERYSYADELVDDSLDGFTLSVTPREVQQGETISVDLTNESDETGVTGNRHKFTVHRRHDGEWESVFTEGEHTGWNAVGIMHEPGEGFTWELTVSEEGFAAAENRLQPCAVVRPGTYRFVYWGVGGEKERETDYEQEYALGATFEVIE